MFRGEQSWVQRRLWDKNSFWVCLFFIDAPVVTSRGQQFKEVMSRVGWVFEDILGSTEAAGVVNVFKEGGKWAVDNFLGAGNDPPERSSVCWGAAGGPAQPILTVLFKL